MVTMVAKNDMSAEQDQRIGHTVAGERTRLRQFIRRYVANRDDAEDILQEVFSELVDAYRLLQPIEQAGAWLMRVARNRIIDRFRKRKHENNAAAEVTDAEGETLSWQDLLPSPEAGPEAIFARQVLMQEIETAIAALPDLQREAFMAHELEGRSFKKLSIELGVSVNTLLSRKHAAVTALRARLQDVYDDFNESEGDPS